VIYVTGGAVRTDIIKACRFMDNERAVKQGDTDIPVKLPLIIGSIKWHQ